MMVPIWHMPYWNFFSIFANANTGRGTAYEKVHAFPYIYTFIHGKRQHSRPRQRGA